MTNYNLKLLQNPILRRSFMCLEDGEFKRAEDFAEQVLNSEPENAHAYLAKLMAELKIKKLDEFDKCSKILENKNDYKKIIRFGDSSLITMMKIYNDAIKERNKKKKIKEKEKRRKIIKKLSLILVSIVILTAFIVFIRKVVFLPMIKYDNALKLLNEGKENEAYLVFSEIKDYKDVAQIMGDFEFRICKRSSDDFEINYIYDDKLNLIKETSMEIDNHEVGSETEYTYDSNGNCIRKSIRQWRYEWSHEFLEEYVYNDYNKPIKITDENGNKTVLEYDSYGYLRSVVMYAKKGNLIHLGIVQAIIYDREGNILYKSKGAVGMEEPNMQYTYDNKGNCIKCVIPSYVTVDCGYDANNNIASIVEDYYDENDSRDTTIKYAYDADNRCIKKIENTYDNEWITEYIYDENGNCIKEKHKNFNGDEYEYIQEYQAFYRPKE